MSDLTGYKWPRMQPASPASPVPKANVNESTRRVEIPKADAIGRFCTTARIFNPKEVRKNHRYTASKQRPVMPTAAWNAALWPCVEAQTSHRSARTSAVQLSGSIGACAR